MGDLYHQWGADLWFGPSGDIATVANSEFTQQRLLRRLLTNKLDYIWQPPYGAGLATFVGRPANVLQIKGLIRSQLSKEAAVAQDPQPIINVTTDQAGASNSVYVQIQYSDVQTNEPQTLSFSVGR